MRSMTEQLYLLKILQMRQMLINQKQQMIQQMQILSLQKKQQNNTAESIDE